MNFMDQYLSSGFMQGLQNFVIAIIALLLGWLVAKMIANAIEKALGKTNLDEKLFNKFRTSDKPLNSNRVVGKVVYYILLIIVFIIFFNLLNLNMIANPLSDLISTFFAFIPTVLKAGLILLLAFAIATVVQWLVVTGGKKVNLEKVFSKLKISASEEDADNALETVGKVAFYLILLLFIPGVLDALSIQGVSEPFSGLLATLLAFIPKLIAAALIFFVGWFVAKIIKGIVVNLLKAAGSEGIVIKLKMQKLFEGTSLAAFVGNLVFILIMIPITIAALEKLELTGITDPAISMLNDIMNMIPNILIAAALILVGVWLGKFIGGFVTGLLQRLGFDGLAAKIQIGNKDAFDSKMKPSALVGYIVQVLIVFFLAVQALTLIKLEFLVDIASAITAYLPNVLAAVLVLGVALIIAGIVETILVNLLAGPASKVLAAFAKYAIIVLAVFMALSQLGIATSIVTTAFTLILGGLALAFGLAFGLGGKEFASKHLARFDQTIEETKIKDKNQEDNL
ncbi:mechanosensitive ion channel [Virgibacillus siamensis]|uniref:mechanosensitive ion channel n=1 Tax=Virgibacillus siamensis TaxID=480071 RepID=UPI0009852683|nr:mechanosensitive ion channel [Virgibacillus siamensis]